MTSQSPSRLARLLSLNRSRPNLGRTRHSPARCLPLADLPLSRNQNWTNLTVIIPRPLRQVLILGLLLLVPLSGLTDGGPAAHADDIDEGIDISVQVVAPSTANEPEALVALPLGAPAKHASFVITLTGLQPLSFVEIFVNSTPVLLASGNADAAGMFQATVTLPASLDVGDHTISATGTMPNGKVFASTLSSFQISADGLLAEPSVVSALPSTTSATRASTTASRAATVTQTTVTAPIAAAAALGAEPFDLGGVFYLSGLVGSAAPMVGPSGGSVTLALTVKNVTASPLDAQARFWLENAMGLSVARSANIAVAQLAPDETRTITTTLTDLGQWGLYSGHITFTPPESVGESALSPISRDTLVFLPPYFLMLTVGGAAALTATAALLWRRRPRSVRPDDGFDAALDVEPNTTAVDNLAGTRA